MAVSLHPYFKVRPGKLEQARALLPEFTAKTAGETACLYYEFTSNGDLFFCREAYADAESALAHLNNVGDLLLQLLDIADLERLEVHGPADELEKLKAPMEAYQPAWFVVECGVKR